MDETIITPPDKPRRIIVGISGASGTPLAMRCLKTLKETGFEIHLVATESAHKTAEYELDGPFSQVEELADVVYSNDDIDAAIASGTFDTCGMIVIPASMKTIAGIANGFSEGLLLRAADVTLKEGRILALVPRETPVNAIHLRNLEALATVPGVRIVPPLLSYYHKPKSLADMEDHIIGKILQQFGIISPTFQPWE